MNGERSLRGPSEPVGSTEEIMPLPSEEHGLDLSVARSTSLPRCPQCSAVALTTDVFCRECGFVVGSAELSSARDTVALEGDLMPPTTGPSAEVDELVEPPATAAERDAEPEPEVQEEPEPEPEPEVMPEAEPDDVPGAEAEAEAGAETDAEPDAVPAAAGSEPEPEPEPESASASVDRPAVRAQLDLVPRREDSAGGAGERFVLHFSTGESATVSGSGLIGRNPVVQPGEFVDQLISVADPAKTVSKTHLEFGQEAGVLWVSDRYATNGSVVRPPDADPWRCEPGRRYRIERGCRVDIGDQFFVVS